MPAIGLELIPGSAIGALLAGESHFFQRGQKNRLFFHRWRPANETYLYLFRKHEQGKNAKEIPQFDPIIEKREREIEQLRNQLLKNSQG